MPASTVDMSTPATATSAFCRAVNEGDLDAARGCFTRDACLVTPDRTAVRGRDEIGAILAQLIAAGAQVSIQVSAVLSGGDVALANQRWRIRSGSPAAAFERDSASTLVLRRVESRWKLAIAAPWGWA
jgi:ketosteroid isomerase-like protein